MIIFFLAFHLFIVAFSGIAVYASWVHPESDNAVLNVLGYGFVFCLALASVIGDLISMGNKD